MSEVLDKVLLSIQRVLTVKYKSCFNTAEKVHMLCRLAKEKKLDIEGLKITFQYGGCGVPDTVIITSKFARVSIDSNGNVSAHVSDDIVDKVAPGTAAADIMRLYDAADELEKIVVEEIEREEEARKRRNEYLRHYAEELQLALRLRGLQI